MEAEETVNKGPQRRENRVRAVQFLYQWELNRPDLLADAVWAFFQQQDEPREYYAFAEDLIHGVLENIDAIDREIAEHLENWRYERVAKVDLAILRLAVHELLHRPDIPPIVSINEAIELGKIFSSPDSKRFINGILDRVKAKINRPLRRSAD